MGGVLASTVELRFLQRELYCGELCLRRVETERRKQPRAGQGSEGGGAAVRGRAVQESQSDEDSDEDSDAEFSYLGEEWMAELAVLDRHASQVDGASQV